MSKVEGFFHAVMLLAKAAFMLCIVVIIGIVAWAFVASSGSMTVAERATSPFGGKKVYWAKMQKDGGLTENSRWYGFNLKSVVVDYDADDFVREFNGSVSKYVYNASDIEEKINEICGFTKDSWKSTVLNDFVTGEAKNQNCHAVYSPDSDENTGISIKRLRRLTDEEKIAADPK